MHTGNSAISCDTSKAYLMSCSSIIKGAVWRGVCFVGLVFWFVFFSFSFWCVCCYVVFFFLILGDFRTKNWMMVVELLFSLHRKMECAFHCWILAGFSTYDKSLICLFLNWIRKNAVRMIWMRRTMKAFREKKATRRKPALFFKTSPNQKGNKGCEQRKRQKMYVGAR